MNKNTRTTNVVFKGLLACALLGCANLFAAPAKNVKSFKQMENPAKWSKNASKGTVQISFDQKEKALSFQETFAPKSTDRWIYPGYNLQLPQESLKGAQTLTFEWKVITEKPLKYANMFVTVKGKDGKYKHVWFPLPLPQPGKWVKCTVALNKNGLDPATITELHLGLNPNTDKVQYFVRNIQFVF